VLKFFYGFFFVCGLWNVDSAWSAAGEEVLTTEELEKPACSSPVRTGDVSDDLDQTESRKKARIEKVSADVPAASEEVVVVEEQFPLSFYRSLNADGSTEDGHYVGRLHWDDVNLWTIGTDSILGLRNPLDSRIIGKSSDAETCLMAKSFIVLQNGAGSLRKRSFYISSFTIDGVGGSLEQLALFAGSREGDPSDSKIGTISPFSVRTYPAGEESQAEDGFLKRISEDDVIKTLKQQYQDLLEEGEKLLACGIELFLNKEPSDKGFKALHEAFYGISIPETAEVPAGAGALTSPVNSGNINLSQRLKAGLTNQLAPFYLLIQGKDKDLPQILAVHEKGRDTNQVSVFQKQGDVVGLGCLDEAEEEKYFYNGALLEWQPIDGMVFPKVFPFDTSLNLKNVPAGGVFFRHLEE
jgi:hypothetical protein